MVEDAQTVTARLEAALAARGCPVEVINGGTAGYSTDQEYLFYRDEGRKYAPDVVVLFVYQNDIPYLALDEYLGISQAAARFLHRPARRRRTSPCRAYEAPPARRRRPRPSAVPSYLVEFVKDALERTSARTYNRLARAGASGSRCAQLEMNDEIRLFHVPELGHLRPAWSAFTWTLQTLYKAVAAAGGRLVVAYVPSRMEVSPRTWELTRSPLRHGREGIRPKAVASRVRYITGRVGIPSSTSRRRSPRANGILKPAYFQTDSHWNARGQEVAGEAVVGFLGRARRCVPAAADQRQNSSSTFQRTVGSRMAGRKLPRRGLRAHEDVRADERDHGQVLGHQLLHAVVEALALAPVEGDELAPHEVVDLLLPGRQRAGARRAPTGGWGRRRASTFISLFGIGVAAGQRHQGRFVVVGLEDAVEQAAVLQRAPPGPGCRARAGRPGRSSPSARVARWRRW